MGSRQVKIAEGDIGHCAAHGRQPDAMTPPEAKRTLSLAPSPGVPVPRSRLGRLFYGLTWPAVAKVFAINTAATVLLKAAGIENDIFDLLISAQIVGFTIMLATYAGANTPLRRPMRPLLLGLCVVVGSVVGTVLVILVKGRNVFDVFNHVEAWWRFATTAGFGIAIGAIGAVVFSARTHAAEAESEAHRIEAERQRLARQMTEARIKVLQAQIEPHFLYNTLANVQALIETDPTAASRMIDNLIRYLRAAVPQMRESGTTLGRDMEMVRAYLDLLSIRMGPRLSYTIELPAELAHVPFPPMMLLPVVENAIKHGLEPVREGGAIHIRAEKNGQRLRVSVADCGRGFPDDATLGQGVGLTNVRERLATLYGDAGQLILEEHSPRGVKALIEVPL
jgi:signal transduction histidine kinase